MSEKMITLEDINTWILKYGELDAPKYSMPHINVQGVLYKGNVNVLSDIISLPEGVDYTVYFENRPVTSISLGVDYDDECTLRVVTKSSYPYVNSDVQITIPVEVKHLESLSDLNKYDYGYIDTLTNVQGVVTNDINIILEEDAVFTGCDLTFDANVTFKGNLAINDSYITNNSSLTFDEVEFTINNTGKDYVIVNNNTLTVNACVVESDSPFILNKDTLSLRGNTFNIQCPSVPFIYSSNTDYSIQGNNINYSETLTYTDFGVCFIRANSVPVVKLVSDNSFNYPNVRVIIDQESHYLEGSGCCYALLDDDVLYVNGLELV